MQLINFISKAVKKTPLLHKLYFGFGTILLVFSYVTYTYVHQSSKVEEAIESLNASTEVLRLAEGLEKAAIDSETGVRGYQITDDSTFLEPYHTGQQEFDEKLAALHTLVINKDQIRRLRKATDTYYYWKSSFAQQSINLQRAALASPGNMPAYNLFLNNNIKKGKGKKLMDSLRAQLTVFDNYERDIRDRRFAELNNSIRFNNTLAVVLTLLSVLAGILIAIAIGQIFRRRLREIAFMAEEVAHGNFSAKIETDRVDEISAVTNSLNRMAEQLDDSFSNLNRLNKELDQFSYVVSHDLKAPLRAINSLAEWIEDDLPDVAPDVKRNLELMRGRVQRMENLINGILTYARIGRKELPTATFSVEALIDEVKDSLDLQDDSITIETELPEITTEKVLLHQVFSNLISNAIKYNNKQNPHIQIGCSQQDEKYSFYVQDNGPGIPPEFHEKVFGVFQTMEARDTKESTGIGLAIVKKILLEKECDIVLTSDGEKGSRFTFTWPTTIPDQASTLLKAS